VTITVKLDHPDIAPLIETFRRALAARASVPVESVKEAMTALTILERQRGLWEQEANRQLKNADHWRSEMELARARAARAESVLGVQRNAKYATEAYTKALSEAGGSFVDSYGVTNKDLEALDRIAAEARVAARRATNLYWEEQERERNGGR
jgi:hypothetical protein